MLEAINNQVPEEKLKDVTKSYFKVLQTILGTVYLEVLQQEGVDIGKNITPAQEQFYDDLVNTIGVLAKYDAPFMYPINGSGSKYIRQKMVRAMICWLRAVVIGIRKNFPKNLKLCRTYWSGNSNRTVKPLDLYYPPVACF